LSLWEIIHNLLFDEIHDLSLQQLEPHHDFETVLCTECRDWIAIGERRFAEMSAGAQSSKGLGVRRKQAAWKLVFQSPR
jgi:hypothetical protein